MPSTVTKVSQRKTLDVASHALASMQVFCHNDHWRFLFFVDCTSDVRWAGEEDLVADAKLLSLKRDYLKIRENRLKNIAFNAKAIGGGSDQKHCRGTTDPRVEFISQDHSSQILNVLQFQNLD